MNLRIYLSIVLILLSAILIFLPLNRNAKHQKKPFEQVNDLSADNQVIEVDLVARYLSENRGDIQYIDIRSHEEYAAFCLPGALNIPFEQLFEKQWQGYYNQIGKTNIFYGNSSIKSSLAVALFRSEGFSNTVSLKGGLNEWFALVMNTQFAGTHLSARENAMYENRRKAKNLFIEYNNLPDSVKKTFLEVKISENEKLDGGCE